MSESTLEPTSTLSSEKSSSEHQPEASAANGAPTDPSSSRQDGDSGDAQRALASETTSSDGEQNSPAKRKRRRKRKRRNPAVEEGSAAEVLEPQAAASARDARSTAARASKDKRADKEATPRRKKRRSPEFPRMAFGTERVSKARDVLAKWRWLPPSNLRALFAAPAAATNAAEATAPEITPPDATDITAPDAPDVTAPDAPDVTAPDATDITAPDAPDVTAPDAPDVTAPDAPDVTAPDVTAPDATGPTSASEATLSKPPAAEQAAVRAHLGATSTSSTESGEPDATSPAADEAAPPGADSTPAIIEHSEAAKTRRASAAFAIPATSELSDWLTKAFTQLPDDTRSSTWVGLCSYPEFRSAARDHLSASQQQELEPYLSAYLAIFLDVAPRDTRHSDADEESETGSTDDAVSADSDAGTEQSIYSATDNVADPRDVLKSALTSLLAGSATSLRAWPLAARERLVDFAAGYEVRGVHSARTAELFPDAPQVGARIRLAYVCDCLARGDSEEAKLQLEALKQQPHAPGLLPVLHGALDGQRFGNLVILVYGGAGSRGSDPKAPKRHSGFCLDSQRDVWIRVGETHDAASFERLALVYRRALIPGIVGLYTFGITRSRKPYLSVLRHGVSLERRVQHSWGLSRPIAVRLANEVALLTASLCRAGIKMPDLAARRFELDDEGRLWLSDLWGAEPVEPKAQDPHAVEQCRQCLLNILDTQPAFQLSKDWREVLTHAADFETLIATLRTLEKNRFWQD